MELKFVTNSYFKQLFQNLKPKLQYSKNRSFMTSYFGTLFMYLGINEVGTYKLGEDNNFSEKYRCCYGFLTILLSYYRSHFRKAKASDTPKSILTLRPCSQR